MHVRFLSICRGLMEIWERYLDSLDSTGGHIIVLMFMMVVGAIMIHYGMMTGDQLMHEAIGALLMSTKTSTSNLVKRNGHDKEKSNDKQ